MLFILHITVCCCFVLFSYCYIIHIVIFFISWCSEVMFLVFYHIMYISDINECEGPSPCDENAQCANTIGSFTCACNEGYGGDGMTCTGQIFTAEFRTWGIWVLALDYPVQPMIYFTEPAQLHIIVSRSCSSVLPGSGNTGSYLVSRSQPSVPASVSGLATKV